MEAERILTVAQAAEWLDVHQNTVRNMVDAGLLPGRIDPRSGLCFSERDVVLLLPIFRRVGTGKRKP